MSKTYMVNDGSGHSDDYEYAAASPKEAARKYVLTGDWPCESVYGDRPTEWQLHVWESGQNPDDGQWVRITTTPAEIPGGTREQH